MKHSSDLAMLVSHMVPPYDIISEAKEDVDVQIMTGVAEANFPTSSSICMIFLMRACYVSTVSSFEYEHVEQRGRDLVRSFVYDSRRGTRGVSVSPQETKGVHCRFGRTLLVFDFFELAPGILGVVSTEW